MLSRFIQLRSGEGRGAAGAFLLLFGILAGHTLLETARDALFLSRLPARHLPWVYLAIAVSALLLSRLRLPAGRRWRPRASLGLWLSASGVVTLSFWFLAARDATWALYALYIWSGLFASVSLVQFWLLLSNVYTLTQAKRLYGLIGGGSVLGAVAGAALAGALASRLDASALLVAAAAVMLLSAALIFVVLPESPARRDAGRRRLPNEVGRGLRLIRNHPYLRRIGALVMLTTAVFTVVDYVFKSEVASRVDPADLGTFFAGFYLVLNAIALVVQFGLVSWLLRVVGVHRALWVLPILLVGGSAGVVLGGGLGAVLFLKGTDGALRHSLYRTSIELLYVPVADRLRERIKPIIDLLGHRGGQAASSLAILAAVAAGVDTPLLTLGVALLAVLWVALAADMRGYYLDLFRATLREGTIETRAGLRSLDLGALETLFQALNSSDDDEVLGALDLLAQQNRINLVPALILYHPARRVVLMALEAFVQAERSDLLPMSERLLGHADPEVRAAVLRARAQLAPDEAELRRALDDEIPLVRATALVGLCSGQWLAPDEARAALSEYQQSPSREEALALARVIRHQPAPVFAQTLLALAPRADDPEVRAELARAMGAIGDEDFIDLLVPWLGDRDTRGPARDALVRIGPAALRAVHLALHDPTTELHLRRHLPRSISRFQNADAADILLTHLLHEPDSVVRHKILRGLGNMRVADPSIEMDDQRLREALRSTIRSAFRYLDWRLQLERAGQAEERRRTPCHELLLSLLCDKRRQVLERLFRLIGLCSPEEDLEQIYRGLVGDDRIVQASARELLEHILEPPLRGAVLSLIDDLPDAEKLSAARPVYGAETLDLAALLAAMIGAHSEGVRSLAAYHAGELGLAALREPIEALLEGPALVAQAAARALVLLDTGEVSHAS